MNLDSSTTITIFILVCIGIFVNLFRWTEEETDARVVTWIASIIFGVILLGICFNVPVKNRIVPLLNPEYITYSSIGPDYNNVNYLIYRWNDKAPLNIEYIGSIEEETKKKFYQSYDICYFGIESAGKIVRF